MYLFLFGRNNFQIILKIFKFKLKLKKNLKVKYLLF